MKTIAIIHAKGESERLPNKNLRLLGGFPLITHAIGNALHSKADKVVVDSDSNDILKVALDYGAGVLKRPPYLARNEITGDDLAYWQAQNFSQYDIIVQVVPTSPFTKPETINKCIENVINGYTSSFTCYPEKFYFWYNTGETYLPAYLDDKNKIRNSKDLEPIIVEYTGVYAFRTDFAFLESKRIDIQNFISVPISHIEKIDINYEEDFEFAEIVWTGLQNLKINIKEKEDLSLAMDQV